MVSSSLGPVLVLERLRNGRKTPLQRKKKGDSPMVMAMICEARYEYPKTSSATSAGSFRTL